MILNALYDYYQRKAEDTDSGIAPRGFERKEIPFIIVIDKEGHFVNLEDTRTGEGSKRRAKTFLVIKTKSRTGVNGWKIANIFWDHWGFVLGQSKNESSKALLDAENQNSTFMAQVKKLSEKYHENSEFRAVCLFYD
jgi:CRISPR-associated protein Csd1